MPRETTTVTLFGEKWLNEKSQYHQPDAVSPGYCLCGDSWPCDWEQAIAIARWANQVASAIDVMKRGFESSEDRRERLGRDYLFMLLAEVRAPKAETEERDNG